MIEFLLRKTDLRSIDNRGKRLIVLSGSLNAFFSVFILFVAARTIPTYDVGILTIAFTIVKLFLNIGKYGMRNYHVTDSTDTTFTEWMASRLITTFVMVVGTWLYCLINSYNSDKTIVVMLVCLIYAGESIEDVYTSHWQKSGRLDISSYIQSVRYIALYLIFSLLLFFTDSMMIASVASATASLVIVMFYLIITVRSIGKEKVRVSSKVLIRLLRDCFPLCLMNFTIIYLSNAPKFEIDKMFDSDVQACFGFISMPIFAISLLCGFMLQPQLIDLSQAKEMNDLPRFKRIVRRMFILIALISLICVIGGWLIGIPVLEVIYGIDTLDSYKNSFITLLIGGGLTAVINFITSLLVIFRQQRMVLFLYVVSCIGLFVTIHPAIVKYDIVGSCIDTIIWLGILSVALYCVYKFALRKNMSCK